MWKWLRSKMSLSMDRIVELERRLELKSFQVSALEAEVATLTQYVGGQLFMSDFQTADQMRQYLNTQVVLVNELRAALIDSLKKQGFTHEVAADHVLAEFSEARVLEMKEQNHEN